MNSDTVSVSFVSITRTPRFNNKAVDIPVATLRETKIRAYPHYFHGKIAVEDMLPSLLKDFSNIIAINITVHNYKDAIVLCAALKLAGKITIGFGEFVTQYYSDIFSLTNDIDYMLLGDHEHPLISFIKHSMTISEQFDLSLHIASKEHSTGKIPYWNTSFVFPVFDYFEQFNRRQNIRKEYLLQTKNAVCNGNCIFCRSRKGHILYRDIKDVFMEIEYAHKNYGIKKFFFTDEDIFDGPVDFSKQRINELCDLIIDSGYIFALKCYMKATALSKHNQEDHNLLNKMYRAGLVVVFIGIESGNTDDLILYQKGTTVEQNYDIIDLLRKHNIFVQIGFLAFNPFSTEKSIENNYYFLKDNLIDNLFMWVGYVRVFKHTKIYDLAKSSGLLDESHFSYIDYSSMYTIKNEVANAIFKFVITKMYPRIYSLDYDFDWLYSFFLDVKRVSQSADKYTEKLNQIKSDQLQRIFFFFKKLYVDADLDFCNKEVNSFLSSFETDQIELSAIYQGLVDMYVAE